jgi:hypothetical protein
MIEHYHKSKMHSSNKINHCHNQHPTVAMKGLRTIMLLQPLKGKRSKTSSKLVINNKFLTNNVASLKQLPHKIRN